MTKYQKIAYGILIYSILINVPLIALTLKVHEQARYIEQLEYEVNRTYEEVQWDIYYENYDPCGLEVVECYPQELTLDIKDL